jgi:hypothetical protein
MDASLAVPDGDGRGLPAPPDHARQGSYYRDSGKRIHAINTQEVPVMRISRLMGPAV